MHYYQHHLGDYSKDTGHLSVTEHGAYRLLLDHYYSTETPLPLEIEKLWRIARASSRAERESVRRVAREFFDEKNGVLVHKRVDRELVEYRRLKEKNATNGRNGGRPKKNPVETQEKPSGLRLGNPDGNPNESHAGASHEPVASSHSKESSIPTPGKPAVEAVKATKPAAKARPAPQTELLPETDAAAARARIHHEITSQFGTVYRDVTFRAYPFSGKDAKALQRFLVGWQGDSELFLDMARQILETGKDQFASQCRKAQSIADMCQFWTSATAEVDSFKQQKSHGNDPRRPHRPPSIPSRNTAALPADAPDLDSTDWRPAARVPDAERRDP